MTEAKTMARTKKVFFGGTKGGVGKSLDSHLADPVRELRGAGRPYTVMDGREPDKLATILSASRKTLNGWLVIDGGGNRPAFDEEIAKEADLCILPFRPSQEDEDTVSKDMERIAAALAWPTAWPTNLFAVHAAQAFIDRLSKKYPGRVISKPIPFVNSASELLAKPLDSPSTPVRRLARKVFSIMEEQFERQSVKTAKRVAAGQR